MTTAELQQIIKRHSVSEIAVAIDEYIYNARDREIARRKILNGERFEPLAEEYDLTPRQLCRIIKQARETIAAHLE